MKMLSKESASPILRGTKRSSSSFSSGDESKKQRGRPRVEPQDETAADRRRTQIRLAQRTYRQRKESTITTLQNKVSQLETIIHEMHACFQGVQQDSITANVGDISSSFNRKIADAAKKFDHLARDAKVEKKSSRRLSHDWPSDETEEVKSPKRGRTGESSSKIGATKAKKASTTPIRTIVSQSERGVPSVWGYETIYDDPVVLEEQEATNANNEAEIFAHSMQSTYPGVTTASMPGYFDLGVSPGSALTPYNGIDFRGPLTPQVHLPLPQSIAFQETSFGRRLHRTVLEAAVRLLNDPNPDPVKISEKFSHVMKYSPKADILTRLTERLMRSKFEPLESNFDYPSASYFGPYMTQDWKLPPEHSSEVDFLGHEDNIGDGAWYAPSDVQTYLEAKGVFIDPAAAVVEWDMDVLAPPLPRGFSPALSKNSDHGFYGTPTSLEGTSLFDFTSEAKSQPHANAALFPSDALSPPGNILPSPSVTPPYEVSESQQLERAHKRVTIDVTKLVGGLITAAVCLGRLPGFRRRDVEKAFRKSITAVAAC